MDRNASIRILLVDDYAVVREGLAALLNRQADMRVVAEAGNGKEAVEAYRTHRPDVTLMDISMPELDGIAAAVAGLAEFPAATIILLSSVDDVFERGRQAGAKACLLKEAPRQELLAAVRSS
jgi:two-component system NarL family response regulator